MNEYWKDIITYKLQKIIAYDMPLWTGLIQLGNNFVSVNITDNFGALLLIIDECHICMDYLCI